MRCINLKLSALFALGLSACSLLVDFPPLPADDSATTKHDGGVVHRDGAVTEVPTGGRDSGPSATCDVANNDNCAGAQLCCDRMDGKGPVCIDTNGGECSACGAACTDANAPNCGARKCECEAGSGLPCGAGQRCMGAGATAHCVQCMADADCATRTDGKQQCVDNACAECDRGLLVNNYSDDQGCPPNKPICNASNICTACTVSPNNCGATMQCDLVVGCTGCTSGVPVGQNGCGGTSPVCGTISTGGSRTALQCRKCANDSECSGGYCVEQTGECTTTCDPDKLPGANHCATAAQPVCKVATAGYACTGCTAAADCTGVTGATHCATQGALSGQCVGCRNNTDCNRTQDTPVCSAAGTCRGRDGSDCGGLTPRFEPTSKACVECLPASQNADCALSLFGSVCTSKFSCGECNTDAECTTADAPVCNTNTNRCGKGCTMDAQCASQSGTPHCDTTAGVCVACASSAQCTSATSPVCSPNTKKCVACNAVTPPTSDNLCHTAGKGEACITTDPNKGQCGACDARSDQALPHQGCSTLNPVCSADHTGCVTCVHQGDLGCSGTRSQCVQVSGTNTFGCNECEPGTNDGCTPPATCSASGSIHCVTPTPPDAGVGDGG